MPEQDASWTGKWAAAKLRDKPDIRSIDLLSPQILKIKRKRRPSFLAATVAADRVERSTIRSLFRETPEIEFVANIPVESLWTGSAITYADDHGSAFGGFSDLLRAIRDCDSVGKYQNPEFAFVERGLRQHSKVGSLERIHDRKYRVKRRDLDDVLLLLLNEYDLIADHVRAGRDRYGSFDVVLKTNPNGQITTSAHQAVESMGAQALKWGELLSRLHKK
jgi:hypothetical protein